jgi:mRNA interferase YafQ
MSKLIIIKSNSFKKSYKRVSANPNFKEDVLENILYKLANNEKLDEKYLDHKLTGDLEGKKECHIQPDILLIYEIRKEELILILLNIGSHSELFG